ncbi:VirC2 family conjugal transfer protein [Breoghania sp. JC706]|uniref:VirC2 family conjugal transfer protein n=1 Tax=Breoghania sp. JC706 TaxID=3117732 RepID=UPI00300A245B
MGIRKPSVSVTEARRLAETRQAGLDIALDIARDRAPDTALDTARDTAPDTARDTVMGRPAPSVPEEVRSAPEKSRSIGPEAGQSAPAKPGSGSPPRPAAKAARAPAAFDPFSARREAKIQVFLSAPLPAPGASRSFDLLTRTHPPARALQMILRRALDLYEARLEDGTFTTLAREYPTLCGGQDGKMAECGRGTAPGGEIEGETVHTSRMMARRLVAIARAHFDPLGFESNRAFGRMLATAALAVFFEAERAGRR